MVVLALQALVVVEVGNPRWNATDWTPKWLPASVPGELKRAPELYVSVNSSSESYVAQYVHADSVFVNPIGLMPIATGGPGWNRFTDLRDRYIGRTRVLFPVSTKATPEQRTAFSVSVNATVDRLGLAINPASCEYLVFNEVDPQALLYLWDRYPQRVRLARTVAACSATPIEPSQRLAELRTEAAAVMDALEDKCPGIFVPHRVQIEGNGHRWTRNYAKFDLFLTVDVPTGAIFYRMERQGTDVEIGNMKTWSRDVQAFRCRRPHDGRRDISTIARDAAL
jgi:hypothetical protein